jgi:hypothetical protein
VRHCSASSDVAPHHQASSRIIKHLPSLNVLRDAKPSNFPPHCLLISNGFRISRGSGKNRDWFDRSWESAAPRRKSLNHKHSPSLMCATICRFFHRRQLFPETVFFEKLIWCIVLSICHCRFVQSRKSNPFVVQFLHQDYVFTPLRDLRFKHCTKGANHGSFVIENSELPITWSHQNCWQRLCGSFGRILA